MIDYVNDPELTEHYEFHLYDVVCKHCRICRSGDHLYENILHKLDCPLYVEVENL